MLGDIEFCRVVRDVQSKVETNEHVEYLLMKFGWMGFVA